MLGGVGMQAHVPNGETGASGFRERRPPCTVTSSAAPKAGATVLPCDLQLRCSKTSRTASGGCGQACAPDPGTVILDDKGKVSVVAR